MATRPFSDEGLNALLGPESWLIRQEGYEPDKNLYHETLLSLQNGYMGVRASLEEGTAPCFPGCYIAGVFGESTEDTRELINVQNWLGLRIFVNEQPLDAEHCTVVEFSRILEMRRALLLRRTLFRDRDGRETLLEGYRYLSRHNVHRAGIRLLITPLNHAAVIGAESTIDASVTNLSHRPRWAVKHLSVRANHALPHPGSYLETATEDYGIGSAAALRLVDPCTGDSRAEFRRTYPRGEQAVEYAEANVEERVTVVAEKFVCTWSTRETDASSLGAEAASDLGDFLAAGHDTERDAHTVAWASLWDVADVSIEGDEPADKALRFNIFQLLGAGPAHSATVSIGAKGLTGERYVGHIFWDTEIFMMPFYAYVDPQTARHLLMYRHHTLDHARQRAGAEGYRGAQFAWQATDTGFESTRKWGFNADGTRFQRWWGEEEIHITADVAYGVYDYYRITRDVDFLVNYGAELLVETARFWVSRCEYNAEHDRYEIHDVVGPDEYHLHVKNNAFTNGMARWNIGAALEAVEALQQDHPAAHRRLLSTTGLTDSELKAFEEAKTKLFVPIDEETGLIEQFEGYFGLRDCEVVKAADGTRSLPPGLGPGDPDDTQILKQADVIILLLLLDDVFDERVKRANFDYYERRTIHASTLSASSYAMLGLRIGDATQAYEYFLRTARNDYGNPKADAIHGIHLAAAGGAWQSAVYGFAGLHVNPEGQLCLRPQAPEHWTGMRFRVLWRGNLLEILVRQTTAEVVAIERKDERIRIKINEVDVTV